MKPLLLMGDSHSVALADAARERGFPLLGGMIAAAPGLKHGDYDVLAAALAGGGKPASRERRPPRLMVRYAQVTGLTSLAGFEGRCVVSLGQAAPHIFNSQDWRKWDFGHPADPQRHYLSRAALTAIAESLVAPSLEFVSRLVADGMLLAAIDGPPPTPDHRASRALGATKIHALAEIYKAPMRALLARHGIPLIAATDIADADGYLLPEYSRGDHIHGNAAYGALLLDRILELLPEAERTAQVAATPTAA